MGRGLLDTLYEGCEGVLELRAMRPGDTKGRAFFNLADGKKIKSWLAEHRGYNVYFGVATRDGKGGGRSNVLNIPCVFVDMDFKSYPGGKEEADRILAGFPLQPTVIVNSGNGYHCYWKLKEPCTLEDEAALKRVMGGLVQVLGADPACAEIARILRVPNTLNVKYNPARKVVMTHCNGSTFDLGDFDFLPEPGETPPKPTKKEQAGNLDRIMECAFMQHCKENAKDLSEPAWYAMITQIMKEPGGIALIHTLSKPYKGYKRAETDRKILQAINVTGPHSCQTIKEKVGFTCGWNCGSTSPAGLAFKREVREAREVGEVGEVRAAREAEGSENQKKGSGEGSAREAERNFRAELRSWVSENSGKFTTSDVDYQFNLRTKTQRDQRSKWLSQLVCEGIIEKLKSERFTFRIRERNLVEMQILEAESAEFPLILPFNLMQYIEINKKEVILLSGESNAGKTAVIFQMMWDNIRYLQNKEILKEKGIEADGIGLRYFSSEMGPAGVRKKLENFGPDYPIQEFVQYVLAVERTSNFHDVLDPDGVNFIDYLEVFDGEYFKLSSYLTLIHAALNSGVAVVALQKKMGTDIGRGGEATLEKPRLALALSENKVQHFFTVKIVKAKHYRDRNPVGLEKDFIIRRRGTELIEVSGWGFPKDHKLRRDGTDYGDWK